MCCQSQAQWWDILRPTVNALYSSGGHVQRLLPLFVMEGLRRDRFASCLAGPGVYDHRCAPCLECAHLQQEMCLINLCLAGLACPGGSPQYPGNVSLGMRYCHHAPLLLRSNCYLDSTKHKPVLRCFGS